MIEFFSFLYIFCLEEIGTSVWDSIMIGVVDKIGNPLEEMYKHDCLNQAG